MKMKIQLMKQYLELGHLSMYKQWVYTKNVDFLWKNDESIIQGDRFITTKHMKAY